MLFLLGESPASRTRHQPLTSPFARIVMHQQVSTMWLPTRVGSDSSEWVCVGACFFSSCKLSLKNRVLTGPNHQMIRKLVSMNGMGVGKQRPNGCWLVAVTQWSVCLMIDQSCSVWTPALWVSVPPFRSPLFMIELPSLSHRYWRD